MTDEIIGRDESEEPIDPPVEEKKDITKSILSSTKKLLGILEDNTEFDVDVIIHINSAILTLSQLGVGIPNFIVQTKEDTYKDFLGEHESLYYPVSMYLYHKTRLGFDPPTSQAMIQTTKDMIDELEWRIRTQMEDVIMAAEKEIMPIEMSPSRRFQQVNSNIDIIRGIKDGFQ